jgi:hypothetical protein
MGGCNGLSLGKNFSILLSMEAAAWSTTDSSRTPVRLAVVDESAFICTNGSQWAQRYVSCFVEVRTGAVVEQRPPGLVAFVNTWEIAVLGANHPPRTVLKYPLS